MNLLFRLAVTVIAGFLGHLTRPFMVKNFTDGGRRFDGWFALLSYSLGVVFCCPFIIWILDHLLKTPPVQGATARYQDALARARHGLDIHDLDEAESRLRTMTETATVASYFLGFGAFGTGTVLGHFLLPDRTDTDQ